MSDPPHSSNTGRFRRKWTSPTEHEDVTHLLKNSVESVLQLQGLGSTSLLAHIVELWPTFVGERISTHVIPFKIEGKELIFRVDHPVWATEIQLLNSRIVAQLESELKGSFINRLKVHVRAPNDLD